MYYVYVLISRSKEKLYIGYTSNLQQRVKQHNSKHKGYTNNDIWDLVYYEAYYSEKDARQREQKLKQHGNSKRFLKERISNSIETI